jgi:hypothetical protein
MKIWGLGTELTSSERFEGHSNSKFILRIFTCRRFIDSFRVSLITLLESGIFTTDFKYFIITTNRYWGITVTKNHRHSFAGHKDYKGLSATLSSFSTIKRVDSQQGRPINDSRSFFDVDWLFLEVKIVISHIWGRKRWRSETPLLTMTGHKKFRYKIV